ncbi:hypothetical protein NXW50_13760 [Bacteroides thetaiotaomicron]|nr:hypothetical protein [Bacteroides thetaiotaomicron]
MYGAQQRKSIISSSGTNIKQEAAKDYDVAAKNGTVNGVNLMIGERET